MGTSFDWDPDKDAENQRKHGVSFAEGRRHSWILVVSLPGTWRTAEPSRASTVSAACPMASLRFGSPIAEVSSASSVQGTGAEARNFMKQTRKYANEPLGRVEVVEDFLPPPDQLVLREDGVKVTISLSKKSVDFFKAHAAKSRVPYQRMIRTLLDSYADKYSQRPRTTRSTGRRSA